MGMMPSSPGWRGLLCGGAWDRFMGPGPGFMTPTGVVEDPVVSGMERVELEEHIARERWHEPCFRCRKQGSWCERRICLFVQQEYVVGLLAGGVLVDA
ncbi:hypothetical protein AC792_11920 [Arthrobacter sp. RIT-PI-e]|nr:hypothetical protein AC792_11920 [Arthrobacter sp. RIT-PI-e]